MARAGAIAVQRGGATGVMWIVVSVGVADAMGGRRVAGFGTPPTSPPRCGVVARWTPVGVSPVRVVTDLFAHVVVIGIVSTSCYVRGSFCLNVVVVVPRGGSWSAKLEASSVLVNRGSGSSFRGRRVYAVCTVCVSPVLRGRRDDGEGDPSQ